MLTTNPVLKGHIPALSEPFRDGDSTCPNALQPFLWQKSQISILNLPLRLFLSFWATNNHILEQLHWTSEPEIKPGVFFYCFKHNVFPPSAWSTSRRGLFPSECTCFTTESPECSQEPQSSTITLLFHTCSSQSLQEVFLNLPGASTEGPLWNPCGAAAVAYTESNLKLFFKKKNFHPKAGEQRAGEHMAPALLQAPNKCCSLCPDGFLQMRMNSFKWKVTFIARWDAQVFCCSERKVTDKTVF